VIRRPIAAGSFYPASRADLVHELEKMFSDVRPPSVVDLKGGIAPHAGYPYSGRCASFTYKAIEQAGPFDSFLVLGFNHTGLGSADIVTSGISWLTPLGTMLIDSEMSERLLKTGVVVDEHAHRSEHSIEVQLPFLQHISKAGFVPLSVAHRIDYLSWGKRIAKEISGSGKRVCVVASSDFTHYGMGYGYVPFQDHVKENLQKLDLGAVHKIEKLDSRGFMDYVDRMHATICGASPIALLIEIMRALDAKDADMLDYITSGDITGDYYHSVSYVSMVFR
jgi:MEMO1 family protein